MTTEVWIAFIATSSLILMIPGPTILFVITQSIANGRKATAPLVAGVVTGDIICMVLSLAGLSALLAVSATLFAILKFLGAAYLIYLGITMFRNRNKPSVNGHVAGPINVGELYRKTLTITALNPKGIIFFSAFMPQFINAESNPEAQLIALATTFLSLAFLNALFYSLLARKVAIFFSTSLRKKWFDITGGTALIGAGAITASAEY